MSRRGIEPKPVFKLSPSSRTARRVQGSVDPLQYSSVLRTLEGRYYTVHAQRQDIFQARKQHVISLVWQLSSVKSTSL